MAQVCLLKMLSINQVTCKNCPGNQYGHFLMAASFVPVSEIAILWSLSTEQGLARLGGEPCEGEAVTGWGWECAKCDSEGGQAACSCPPRAGVARGPVQGGMWFRQK